MLKDDSVTSRLIWVSYMVRNTMTISAPLLTDCPSLHAAMREQKPWKGQSHDDLKQPIGAATLTAAPYRELLRSLSQK